MPISRLVPLVLVAALAPGCMSSVVWAQRPGPEPGNPNAVQTVPTCPDCGRVLDWEGDRCRNAKNPIRIWWWEPRELD